MRSKNIPDQRHERKNISTSPHTRKEFGVDHAKNIRRDPVNRNVSEIRSKIKRRKRRRLGKCHSNEHPSEIERSKTIIF